MIYTVHAKTADGAAGDQTTKTHVIRTESMRKRGIKAMGRKYYVLIVDRNENTFSYACSDYNNAEIRLLEILTSLPTPIKGCILNEKLNVIYTRGEYEGKNDSKGRSNRTDKT